MFAVVDIAGQQFKVSSGEKIYVNRLDEKEGSSIKIDKVLLINDTKTTLENRILTMQLSLQK